MALFLLGIVYKYIVKDDSSVTLHSKEKRPKNDERKEALLSSFTDSDCKYMEIRA